MVILWFKVKSWNIPWWCKFDDRKPYTYVHVSENTITLCFNLHITGQTLAMAKAHKYDICHFFLPSIYHSILHIQVGLPRVLVGGDRNIYIRESNHLNKCTWVGKTLRLTFLCHKVRDGFPTLGWQQRQPAKCWVSPPTCLLLEIPLK